MDRVRARRAPEGHLGPDGDHEPSAARRAGRPAAPGIDHDAGLAAEKWPGGCSPGVPRLSPPGGAGVPVIDRPPRPSRYPSFSAGAPRRRPRLPAAVPRRRRGPANAPGPPRPSLRAGRSPSRSPGAPLRDGSRASPGLRRASRPAPRSAFAPPGHFGARTEGLEAARTEPAELVAMRSIVWTFLTGGVRETSVGVRDVSVEVLPLARPAEPDRQ